MTRTERFIGGSPAGVIARLIVLSIVIGVFLSWLNATPLGVFQALRHAMENVLSGGIDLVRNLLGYLLLGAAVVLPVWLVIRLIAVLRPRKP